MQEQRIRSFRASTLEPRVCPVLPVPEGAKEQVQLPGAHQHHPRDPGEAAAREVRTDCCRSESVMCPGKYKISAFSLSSDFGFFSETKFQLCVL